MLTGFEVVHQVGQDHKESGSHDWGNPVCAEVDELVKHGSFLYSYSIAQKRGPVKAPLQVFTVGSLRHSVRESNNYVCYARQVSYS